MCLQVGGKVLPRYFFVRRSALLVCVSVLLLECPTTWRHTPVFLCTGRGGDACTDQLFYCTGKGGDTHEGNSSINMRVQSSITQPLYLKTAIREFSYRREGTYTKTKGANDLEFIKLTSCNISTRRGFTLSDSYAEKFSITNCTSRPTSHTVKLLMGGG